MKILVTGVNGQLGYDVVLELSKRGHEIIATDVVLPDIDFCQQQNRKATGFCDCAQKDENKKDFCQQPTANSQQQNRESPNFDAFCSIMSESNRQSQTTNREKLTFVSLDITDKEAVHRIICGEKSPLFCTSSPFSAGEAAHKQGAKRELLRLYEVAYTEESPATCYPSSCAQTQEPVTLGCNESRNGFPKNSSFVIHNSSFSAAKPDCVVHCAAYTAVDAAEDNEELCRAVNVEGTRNIAEACAEIGAKMIYISTDYVFSGEGTEPWQADCRDFAPQNVYGKSKLDGEFAVAENLDKFFIVRTAWVFGNHGNNFVKTMLKVGATHDEVRVVKDQVGTPTYTPDLARLLCDMAESDKYGYYHATNEGGFISWYDFTREIYRQAGYNTKVIPVTTAEYGLSKAKRPFNSRLDKSKLSENGFEILPDWQDGLGRYLKTLEGIDVKKGYTED